VARDENKPYRVWLTIGHGGKGVPYGGMHGEARDDGTSNHGFKNLKGRPHLLSEIPEIQNDPALHELVRVINEPENGLVSVGCAGWPVSEDQGHRWSGYIEFAINSAEMIEDARSYFWFFFHFDRMLHNNQFDQMVNYNWELEGANFHPARADGFTCTIWINLPYVETAEAAFDAWQMALDPLIPLLGGYPVQEGRPLFTADTDEWGPSPAPIGG
jgi:hypothetical protein